MEECNEIINTGRISNERRRRIEMFLRKEEEEDDFFFNHNTFNFNIGNHNNNSSFPQSVNNPYKKRVKELLEKYPEKIIDEIDNNNKRCIICLYDFVINDVAIYLPCFHCFHKECISIWLEKKAECPLCKNKI